MKAYPKILNRVLNEPWVITATAHRNIQRTLARAMDGDVEAVDGPEAPIPPRIGGVAIIPVHGILGKHLSMLEMMCGGCSIDAITHDLQAAANDGNVSEIWLCFNTPGGAYPGLPELGRLIRAIDATKPVYAFTDNECCSGGLWLASQAREFICTPSSTIGSVGVYSVYLDESAALEMEGIKVNAISAGEYKLIGAPFKPMTDDERGFLQARADGIHAEFKDAVRGVRPVDDEYLEGLFSLGEEAVEIGFCNSVADSLEEAMTLTTQPTAMAGANA